MRLLLIIPALSTELPFYLPAALWVVSEKTQLCSTYTAELLFLIKIHFLCIKARLAEKAFHLPLPSGLPEVGNLFFYSTTHAFLLVGATVVLIQRLHVAVRAKWVLQTPFFFGPVLVSCLLVAKGAVYRLFTKESQRYYVNCVF